MITVSVLGLSGPDSIKGSVGVGKSLFCNRFVRPDFDGFFTEHISTLSQADFSGSPVINGNHWLYWGERMFSDDQHGPVLIRVLEQTEFVDDESFVPLPGASGDNSYVRRATRTRLESADKLMYICKEQLGLEADFDQNILPEGRANVDAFVFVYDISVVPRRPFERQSDIAAPIIVQAAKTKRPIVIVASKGDEGNVEGRKALERLLARKELRSLALPTVMSHLCLQLETSALLNVNIEAAFSMLVHLIEKCRCKQKLNTYTETFRQQNDQHQLIRRRYLALLRELMPLSEWPTKRATWSTLCNRLGLSRHPYFMNFCVVFGRAQAQKLYRQYVNEAREHWMQIRLQTHLPKLTQVLADLLAPESLSLCWAEVVDVLRAHPLFDEYFEPLGGLAADLDPATPSSSNSPSTYDSRIPAEILLTADAESVFIQYVNLVEAESRRGRLEDEFLALLSECGHVTPGKPLSDVQLFLRGKPCFESLAQNDAKNIYQRYQVELVRKAEQDFMELLLEEVDLFVDVASVKQGGRQNRPLLGLDEKHMKHAREVLQEDIRYRRLNGLFEQRDKMIGSFASFVSYPLVENCPSGARCVDMLAEQVISQVQRYDKLDLNPVIELAVSGNDESVVDEFITSIQDLLPDGCYETNVGIILRIVCTRITSPPVIRCWARLRVMLLSDRQSLDLFTLDQAFAPIIVLCSTSHNYNDMAFLMQQGALLAESAGGNFIVGRSAGDAALDNTYLDYGLTFSRDQLLGVLETAAGRVTESRSPRPSDLRVQLSMMCGDSFTPQSLLSSLLSNAKRATQSNSGVTTSIDVVLPSSRQNVRVDVRVSALHTSLVSSPSPFIDGLIVAYSARRPASFAHARALARRIPPSMRTRTMIAAVADVVDFFKEQRANQLLTAGDELAQALGAAFVTVSGNGDRASVNTYLDFFEHLYSMRGTGPPAHITGDYMTLSEMGATYWMNNNTTDSKMTRLSDCTTASLDSTGSHRVFNHSNRSSNQDPRYRTPPNNRLALSPNSRRRNQGTNASRSGPAAPLATPEGIEIAAEYSIVQDAIKHDDEDEEEHIYVSLDDRSVDRISTASSRGSNLSPNSSYDNSGQSPRRQSKTSNDRVRLFYASPAEVADAPKAGPKKTSFVGNLVSSKSAGALHNHGTPSTVTDEDDEEAEEEAVEGEKQSSGARETANRFAKKLRSSFRFGKSKKTAAKTGGGQSENLGTRSVPQSPQTERAAISVAPPSSRLSTDRTTSSFSWLPSRSPRRDRTAPSDTPSPASRTSSPPVLIEDPELLHAGIRKCISYIEKEGGLELEGLYRVPGNQAQVQELERALQENQSVDIGSLDMPVHAVATALKNFVARLPEPLIPYPLQELLLNVFEESSRDEKEAVRRIAPLLQQEMTTENRGLLRFFTEHMQRVSRASAATSMDVRNLAKVWWPTLFRPNFDSFESMAAAVNKLELLTQMLFRNSTAIFLSSLSSSSAQ